MSILYTGKAEHLGGKAIGRVQLFSQKKKGEKVWSDETFFMKSDLYLFTKREFSKIQYTNKSLNIKKE